MSRAATAPRSPRNRTPRAAAAIPERAHDGRVLDLVGLRRRRGGTRASAPRRVGRVARVRRERRRRSRPRASEPFRWRHCSRRSSPRGPSGCRQSRGGRARASQTSRAACRCGSRTTAAAAARSARAATRRCRRRAAAPPSERVAATAPPRAPRFARPRARRRCRPSRAQRPREIAAASVTRANQGWRQAAAADAQRRDHPVDARYSVHLRLEKIAVLAPRAARGASRARGRRASGHPIPPSCATDVRAARVADDAPRARPPRVAQLACRAVGARRPCLHARAPAPPPPPRSPMSTLKKSAAMRRRLPAAAVAVCYRSHVNAGASARRRHVSRARASRRSPSEARAAPSSLPHPPMSARCDIGARGSAISWIRPSREHRGSPACRRQRRATRGATAMASLPT